MKSKLSSHNTSFLIHLITVANKYKQSAGKKYGLSTDDSDDCWGVNIWRNEARRVQFAPASEFDGPEATDEFFSISDIKYELNKRDDFNVDFRKKENKKNGKVRMDN